MENPQSNNPSNNPNNCKISIALITINVPQEINSKTLLSLATIIIGVPVSFFFWICSFNYLMNMSEQLSVSPSRNSSVLVDADR